MKNKPSKNYSGIVICDSITMSVKKKKLNLRRLESVIIALVGFVSVIMSFLTMFDFEYNKAVIIRTAVILSVIHIVITLIPKKTLLLACVSFLIFAGALYRFFNTVYDGFKYVYNVIYSDAHHTDINYYKLLDPKNEILCTTVFFIFCIWILSIAVYVFTISRPNPLIIIIFTFPIIEIGLYNGIHIPVFWGILTVAYWLAIVAIFNIDTGEYYGGTGGFVRKENVFFPKRQMRLKVTEKCALSIILLVTAVTAATLAVMHITNYKRSDKLNQKRIDIKEAVNNFSLEDIASSLSQLTEAFGFTFNYESHKLGNIDHIKYKDITDIIVTFDHASEDAVYLKGYAGAVYRDNEWLELQDSVYKKNNALFGSFEKYKLYPQDFPHIFSQAVLNDSAENTVWIGQKRRKDKSFAPYGTNNYGDIKYKKDLIVSSKKNKSDTYSYKFVGIEPWKASKILGVQNSYGCITDLISDEAWKKEISSICADNGLDDSSSFEVKTNLILPEDNNTQITDGQFVITALLEDLYRDFVYDNYLQIPNNNEMNEVRDNFSDIIDSAQSAQTAYEKLMILDAIRQRIASMADYSLSPGETPSNRDFVNYFLLENHHGYCAHYATSGVILARMAGIPARYATGYVIVGDDFESDNRNPDGTYTINVQDNRSHAWAEIYLDGFGWVPFEFTEGYSNSNIDTSGTTTSVSDTSHTSETQTTTAKSPSANTKETETTRKTTSATESSTTVSVITTTKKSINNSSSNGSFSNFLHSGSGKIISAAAVIILIMLLIFVRRCIIINLRSRRFTKGKNSLRMSYMYDYTEKLLKVLKIYKNDMQYIDFANYAENKLSPEYFASGEFIFFMNCALESNFGNCELSKETLQRAQKFTENFSRIIYSKSNLFKKIYLKFILVLK